MAMFSLHTPRIASMMIYLGTFLVSVLSFFTTYMGLAIFLDRWLALLGSLGLQTAMLGIAWSLMRIRRNRMTFVTVFSLVAMFSIFFSYVNFNTRLKGELRTQEARAEYADAARPVLRSYALQAKEAVSHGEYQVQRLSALLEMEKANGWATVIDEGSNDPFLQSVINGARRTVESWRANSGSTYRQGSGEGVITDYLKNWRVQIDGNLSAVETYVASIDSISLLLGSEMPVADQYNMVNYVAVHFPHTEYKMILAGSLDLAEPPFASDYVERPVNGQQALSLVIGDLFELDRLTAFSLIFATVIDFMEIVMALCGSRATGGLDGLMDKPKVEAEPVAEEARPEDPIAVAESIKQNIEWLRRESRHNRDLERVLSEFTPRERVTLIHPGEGTANATSGSNALSMPRRRKTDNGRVIISS